jgi:hypothetical protein
MKPYKKFRKLPLIALLSLGLACTPLVAGADGGERGRHGYSQQDRGKSHHGSDHRREYRDYGHQRKQGYRKGYNKGYRHGYKSGHHYDRRHNGHRGHYGNYHDVHRHYRHGPRHDYASLVFGLYSDNLDVIFRD